MLVNEGPFFFCVAFVADLVAGSVGPQLFRAKRTMWIVAVVTLDQTFVDPMVEWPSKFCADVLVTGVTKVGRLGLH